MQVKTFRPKLVSVRHESLVEELKEALSGLEEKPEIIPGEQGIIEVNQDLCPHIVFYYRSFVYPLFIIFLCIYNFRLPAIQKLSPL